MAQSVFLRLKGEVKGQLEIGHEIIKTDPLEGTFRHFWAPISSKVTIAEACEADHLKAENSENVFKMVISRGNGKFKN